MQKAATHRPCLHTDFLQGRVVTALCTSSLHNIFRFHVKEHGTGLQNSSHIFGSVLTCSHHTLPALQGGSGHCQVSWSIRYLFLRNEASVRNPSPLLTPRCARSRGVSASSIHALWQASVRPGTNAHTCKYPQGWGQSDLTRSTGTATQGNTQGLPT